MVLGAAMASTEATMALMASPEATVAVVAFPMAIVGLISCFLLVTQLSVRCSHNLDRPRYKHRAS